MVSFTKGTNYNSCFVVSENFALTVGTQFIHSQKEIKGRMNPFFLSTDPELQLLYLRNQARKVDGLQTA